MRSHFCLFIGLSGDDISLTSILNSVSKNHVLQKSESAFWGVTFLRNKEELEISNWEKYGVFINEIDNFKKIPEFLFEICQKAAEMRKS